MADWRKTLDEVAPMPSRQPLAADQFELRREALQEMLDLFNSLCGEMRCASLALFSHRVKPNETSGGGGTWIQIAPGGQVLKLSLEATAIIFEQTGQPVLRVEWDRDHGPVVNGQPFDAEEELQSRLSAVILKACGRRT